MSWNAVLEFEAACAESDPNRPPLDWLLAMLKQTMEETMASEAKPLQKANAIARLANLYLKACGATELKKENKLLKQRLKEIENTQACDASPAPASPAPTAAAAAPALAAPLRRPAQAPRPRHVKRR